MPKLLRQRLLWALAVSAALHLLLMFQAEIPFPDWMTAHEPIEVTMAPPPQSIQPAALPESHKPKPQKKLAAQAKPKSIAAAHEPPRPLPPPKPEQLADVAAGSAATVDSPAPMEQASEEKEPPPQLSLPEIPDEPVAVPPPPKHVEIEFRGLNGSKGMGKQVFERDDNGHYKLTGEMSMPVILFISGKIEQHSAGLITPQGLQPTIFRQQITASKPQQATFDWDKHKVVLDTGKRTDTLDLPPGTQDMLSFMYQFMFVPPLNEMRLNLVTGKKLRTYVYTFEGEETLDTPMGKLQTVHIGRNNSDGDERTELWLASEYRYLPVRIRRTEKDGAAIDLMVTRLSLTE